MIALRSLVTRATTAGLLLSGALVLAHCETGPPAVGGGCEGNCLTRKTNCDGACTDAACKRQCQATYDACIDLCADAGDAGDR